MSIKIKAETGNGVSIVIDGVRCVVDAKEFLDTVLNDYLRGGGVRPNDPRLLFIRVVGRIDIDSVTEEKKDFLDYCLP